MKEKEIVLRGIPAAPGIITGRVLLLDREQYVISRRPLKEDQVSEEIKHFKDALVQTKQELMEIKKRISEELSAEHGQIFSAHLLVLEDSMLIEEVVSKIKKERPLDILVVKHILYCADSSHLLFFLYKFYL